jgi:hypothetical protein
MEQNVQSVQLTSTAKLLFLTVAITCTALTIYYGFYAESRPRFVFIILHLLVVMPMATGILISGYPSIGLRLPKALFVAVYRPAPSPIQQALQQILSVAVVSYLLFNTWIIFSKESELMYWDQELTRFEEQIEKARAALHPRGQPDPTDQ